MNTDVPVEWLERLDAKGFDVLEPSPGQFVVQARFGGARIHLEAKSYAEAVQEAVEEVLPMLESNE